MQKLIKNISSAQIKGSYENIYNETYRKLKGKTG